MRRALSVIFIVAFGASAQAASMRPDSNAFGSATGIYDRVQAVTISKADYLPGTTRADVCRAAKVRGFPVNGLYEAQAYDPEHHLVLANFFTDGCNVVLYSSVLPASAKVPHKDLSSYRSARGLSVGSSYDEVRRIYGAPANSSARFVLRYRAMTGKMRSYGQAGMVDVPEDIVLLIKNQRVASIAILIDYRVLT